MLGNLGPHCILQLSALPHLGRRCLVARQPRQRHHVGVALAAPLRHLSQVGAYALRHPAQQLLLAHAAVQVCSKLLLQCQAKQLRHALQRHLALGAMRAGVGTQLLLQRHLVCQLALRAAALGPLTLTASASQCFSRQRSGARMSACWPRSYRRRGRAPVATWRGRRGLLQGGARVSQWPQQETCGVHHSPLHALAAGRALASGVGGVGTEAVMDVMVAAPTLSAAEGEKNKIK